MRSFSQMKREASQILPNLFLSDALTVRRGGTLDRLKITHIISVVEKPIKFPKTAQPLKLLHIPASDGFDTDLLSFMDQTTEFIKEAIGTNEREQEQLRGTSLGSATETTDGEHPMLSDSVGENRVLVHCFAGMSRSATIVIAYLLATTPMTVGEATEFVRSKRSVIRPNYGFIEQLEQYEKRCLASTGKTATPKKMVETGVASREHLYRSARAGLKRYVE
jgi:atypical dual specificity phosphatase